MKNVKKIAVRSCVVLLFIAGFEFMARFCHESWKTYLLTSKRERSEMKGTIETLYCGTSLAARAFQPATQDYIDGGPAFSAVFAEVLQSSDPQAFFYDSIKDFGERLKEEEA